MIWLIFFHDESLSQLSHSRTRDLKIRGCLVRTRFAFSYLLLIAMTWWYGVIESGLIHQLELTSSDRMTTELNWTIRDSSLSTDICRGHPGRKIPSASPAQTHPSSAGLLRHFVKRRAPRVGFPHPPQHDYACRLCVCAPWIRPKIIRSSYSLKEFLYENYAKLLAERLNDLRAQKEEEILSFLIVLWNILQ